MDRHEVLGTHVLAAAEEVGDGVTVVVEPGPHRSTAASDVTHDRNVLGFQQGPQTVVVGMRG